ncbi:uncharacterized protein LACBIDRAFT_303645 [Laccaria bicolor S238N-H82]|uniref:Predicted protein n=1 Tax=Laccaria bicolor (strain S238N-H82 / ATCC MYA-4686) TaxID=486041 RepID=B0E480_LACBS|nr:uncharacterized protein LACBIDRAFT_303645 [Laccaria bicolor S238N-H82]EDQ98350.1 predicted protein [Laccaria bicolor S238N-H82]|eukprot:XP_001890998.1 predicted protein [Laccaria bicolor S238N-H82]
MNFRYHHSGLYGESRQPAFPLDRPSFTEIESRSSSPTISSPSMSDPGSPTELSSMPLFVDGPALRTFFSDSVAKGRESVSSAQATLSNPPSFLWQMTSEQLVQFGQTNPEQFKTIQSHICELADLYRLKTIPENATFEYPTNILLHIPLDIQKLILDNLAIPALLRLSKCCRYLSHAVNAYITARIEGILTSFSIDPHKLLEGMETCGAFIGGSVALLAVLANVDSFAPNDLDIYVPEAHAETLAKRILSRFKSVGGHSPIYVLNPAITHVEWYTSTFHPLIRINLIATKSASPLEALFHSGASITMNAITGLSLPTAKLFRAVRNRSPLPQDEAHTILAHFGISVPVTALPWELMELLVKKYKSRVGVTFIRDLAAIKDHVCGEDPSCSFTLRTSADSGCAFFPFRPLSPLPTLTLAMPVTPVVPKVVENPIRWSVVTPKLISWCVGGCRCAGDGVKLPSLVSSLPADYVL